MDLPDISTRDSLVSSRRDLDAPKRGRDVATPKKRMLGVTPRVVFKVDAPKTPKLTSLATPYKYLYIYIYICGRTAEEDKIKRECVSKSHQKVCVSKQAKQETV